MNEPAPSPAPSPDFFGALREPKHRGGVGYTPEIIGAIIANLRSRAWVVAEHRVDVGGYRAYFDRAAYAERYPTYYATNLPEKSLEHYIAATLLELSPGDVYIDIASEGSPVPEIYERLYGCTTYRQDLTYPPGLNGRVIGGDAAAMPLPGGFASKMALHCSFEHFEGESDRRFISEARRVLAPGGSVCIVPLYLFDRYAIQTDPGVAVTEQVQFEEDAVLYCQDGWGNRHGRFYDPDHLTGRVRGPLDGMQMTIFRIPNAREVDPSCYAEFAALIHKP
jgi:SAM-dependent methyltransferase